MDIIIIFTHFIIIITFYLQRATTMKISRMSSLCQNQVLWSVSCRKSIIIISCNIIIKRERRASHIIIIILLCSSIGIHILEECFLIHMVSNHPNHIYHQFGVLRPHYSTLFSTFIALSYVYYVGIVKCITIIIMIIFTELCYYDNVYTSMILSLIHHTRGCSNQVI